MNTIDPQLAPPEDGNPAAEYVLGVLNASERRAVEARIAAEPAFASEVGSWETRLMPLIDEIASVNVPDYVWVRIRSSLNLSPARAPATPSPTSLWQSLAFWRSLAGGAFAAAAAFAIALFIAPAVVVPPPPVNPSMASTLAHDDGSPGFIATINPVTGTMTITPVAGAPTDGRVAELWLIPQGQAPRSLGVVDAAKAQLVRIPDRMLAELGTQAILAVTLEPPGGAPGGVPSGPIIAKGGIALL